GSAESPPPKSDPVARRQCPSRSCDHLPCDAVYASGACRAESALEVPDQIIQRFEPHREADRARADSGGSQLLVAQLAVRRTRGVDDQALGVANVREVTPQLERSDELLARLPTTAQIKREYR